MIMIIDFDVLGNGSRALHNSDSIVVVSTGLYDFEKKGVYEGKTYS